MRALKARAGLMASQVAVDGVTHDLHAGDCQRYQLHGPSAFVTPAPAGAHYVLFIL